MIDVNKIRKHLSLLEIASKYLDLEIAPNGEYRAVCPFHDDTDPSFYINEEKGLYNCFGCGANGDVVQFIEKIEGLDFVEALERLSIESDYDVELETNSDEFDINKFIKAVKSISKNEENKSIKFDEEVIEKYKNKIHKDMLDLGFEKETLKTFEIGYCNDLTDELYKRITFVWRNEDSEIVAVTGRDTTNKSKNKYKSKTGSNKKDNLYNINYAQHYADDGIVVVEDEKSVLRLYEFGFKNVVALGNNLMKDRYWKLRTFTGTLYLAYDNDKEGQKEQKKIIKDLAPLFKVYIVELPKEKKDIAEIKNKSTWLKCWNNRRRMV